MLRFEAKTFGAIGFFLLLVGCSGTDSKVSDDDSMSKKERREDKLGKMFGDDLFLFGGDEQRQQQAEGGLGVNYYLWRGALDTVSFMPLRSVDPFGGVIISEWYTPPESPSERLKVDIVILDRQLRADGVRVSIHKQKMAKSGWQDTFVDPKSFAEFEEAILTRARQIKMNNVKS
ncbi:MAG: DUF3576 domain-containing protein [Pseudomonadota bacterium]